MSIKISNKTINEIHSLYHKGLSYPKIAKATNVGVCTASKYCRMVFGKRKPGQKIGFVPWNKGLKGFMKGNKHAFLGSKAKKATGNMRAWTKFRKIEPCNRCGKKLASFFMVRHHKNEDTLDNRKSNIEFLCRSCHAKHHRKLNWKNRYEHRRIKKIR